MLVLLPVSRGWGEEGSLRRDVQFFPSSCWASSKRAKIADTSSSLTCRQQRQVMPAMCFTRGCANLGIFPELDHSHKNNSLPSRAQTAVESLVCKLWFDQTRPAEDKMGLQLCSFKTCPFPHKSKMVDSSCSEVLELYVINFAWQEERAVSVCH